MIVALAIALPALLVPHLRKGQQFHYRTTWTRRLDHPVLAGAKPLESSVAYTVSIADASPAHLSWVRRYTGGDNATMKFTSDASGTVVDKTSGQPIGLPVIFYNSTLLGQPAEALRPGQTWSNSISHPAATEHWTSTVEEANATTGVVRLHVSFEGHSASSFAGDKYSREQREDGVVVFAHGVMTKLSLRGREVTTYAGERRFTHALAVETSLQDPSP